MIFPPAVGGAAAAYEIEKSLRFRLSASATLTKTFGASGNRQKWTISLVVKRGQVTRRQFLMSTSSSGGATSAFYLDFLANDQLEVGEFSSGWQWQLNTSAVLRDPTSDYHIVVRYDSAQATASDRVKIEINGQLITSFAVANYPSLGFNSYLNSGSLVHTIGNLGGSSNYLDAYLSDVHFIDGQSLAAAAFGETDAITGAWVAKRYSGSYGTNGFFLDFADGTSLTTLVADASGNGNNWTANNVSLTAGATYDWMDDTQSSNFAVLNPLNQFGVSIAAGAVSDGNLKCTAAASSDAYSYFPATVKLPDGKIYFECDLTGTFGATIGHAFGVLASRLNNIGVIVSKTNTTASIFKDGAAVQTGLTWNSGDTFGITWDGATREIQFYRNGTAFGTAVTATTGYDYYPTFEPANQGSQSYFNVNFGQRPFAYTPPTGFQKLCADNLTSTTITASGSFTGNASTDGPCVWLNGVPTAMTINGNAVTFATHADKLANGVKVRSSSASYNTAGSNTYSITTTGAAFKNARAQVNP